MRIDLNACHENACVHAQDRLDAAADAADHYGAAAFAQLHDEFLAAALKGPDALLYVPGYSRPQLVGELVAQEIVGNVGDENLRLLAAMAKGEFEGVPARAMALLDGLADQHADQHCDALAVALEDEARDEAEEARTDARIDAYEWARAA